MSLQQITANDILNLPANTVSNTQLVAGSVENYLSSQNSFITYRNRIHNGEMAVNQRATANVTNTASILNSALYNSIDRWKTSFFNNSGSFNPTISWKQTTDHPIKGSNGSCLEIVAQTSATPSGNVDFFGVLQSIEAQHITDLFCGANSPNLTLSFWVKTNVTGTYSVQLRDQGTSPGPNGQYIIVSSYTVPTSGVWQKVVLNFPAPTYSAMPNSVNAGLGVGFYYASSETLANTPGINPYNNWASLSTWGFVANTQANLFSTAGNYFRLTDVQLESGSTATPFERRPYAVELQLCQRYYFQGQMNFTIAGSITTATNGQQYYFVPYNLPVSMRTTPSITPSGSNVLTGYTYNNQTLNLQWGYTPGPQEIVLKMDNPSGGNFSTPIYVSAEI